MPAVNLRFSASAASKYHNCHASANLVEAIPGFELKPKEHAQARDQGTALHKILENIVNEVKELHDAATMLREIAGLTNMGNAKTRTTTLTDEKKYVTWWFLKTGTPPVLEHKYLRALEFAGAGGMISTPPKLIRFLADCVDYIADIMDDHPNAVVRTEVTVKATWLSTEPNTTVDIIITDGDDLWVIDLKAGTIAVEVVGNEQLLYYAACFDTDQLRLHLAILQQDNIGEWDVTPLFLQAWMYQMQDSEQAILDGDMTFRAGSHCTFCPANPRGKGDKGYPFCPEMIEILYGASDDAAADEAILED